jgi:hypothetical protein
MPDVKAQQIVYSVSGYTKVDTVATAMDPQGQIYWWSWKNWPSWAFDEVKKNIFET